MPVYIFDIKLKTSKGHEIGIDSESLYGYFTRADGSEGGGLWFERNDTGLELIDYDGVIALPAHVYVKLCDQPNMTIDESFDPNYES